MLTTRTPPHTALIIRASASGSSSETSSVLGGCSGSPKFVTTSPIPTRLAMATPFQRPSPWCATSYPAPVKASRGISSSASLVSCMSRTSGFARSSHHVTFSSRAFSELTFQVAIRIRSGSPGPDERGKAVQPLQAFVEALGAAVEDELADAEPRVGIDVLEDLLRRAAEWPAPFRVLHLGVVDGRLEG